MKTPAIRAELVNVLRRANGPLTSHEIADLTGRSHPYIARQMTELHDAGQVDRHGGGGREGFRWTLATALTR